MSYRGDAIVARIREGLYDAVLASDDVDVADLDSITFQKLLLKAVEAFNLEEEVTTSWYLDGEVLYSREANFDRFGGGSEYRSVSSTMRNLAGAPEVELVKEYYLSRIDPPMEDIVDERTFEYLRAYYEEEAPPRYRQIYLSNIELATSLDDIERTLGRGCELAESMEHQVMEPYEGLSEEVAALEELAPTEPYLETFGEMLRQFASWYDSEANEISHFAASSAVGSFKAFYFEGAWRPVALVISRKTADGSRDDKLKNERDVDLDNHLEKFTSEFTALRGNLSESGIGPEAIDSGSWERVTTDVRERVEAEAIDEDVVGDAIEWARSR